MSLGLFLAAILPLVAFVLVDAFAGPKAGVMTAISLGMAWLLWSYFAMGELDNLALLEVGLILGLGLTSIRMQSPVLFKFQPVVVAVVTGIIIGIMQWSGEPLFERMLPRMKPLLQPELYSIMSHPSNIAFFNRVSAHLPILLFAHAALVAVVAKKANNWWWLVARIAVFPMMLIMIVLERMFF